MKREIGDYIEDILEAMTNAIEFTKDMSYEKFVKDTKTVYAVIRAIEIIGEAVKNIPEDIRKKYPDIPWRSMAGIFRPTLRCFTPCSCEGHLISGYVVRLRFANFTYPRNVK